MKRQNKNLEPRSDSIGTEKALIRSTIVVPPRPVEEEPQQSVKQRPRVFSETARPSSPRVFLRKLRDLDPLELRQGTLS